MANILGQLLVELGINTAAFKEGLDSATYQTKAFGSEVEKTFRQLGGSVEALAGSFGILGPAGLALTEAMSLAGGAAGKMIKEFAGADKTFGIFAGAAAGAAAAALSVAGSSTALAVETSKSIKEMGEQAMMAGVSVTELSKLSYAASLAGVGNETLVTGLERMNKSALSAAEGNKQLQAAFRLVLGDGKAFDDVIKTGHVSLETLADGFAKIQDPQEKSALAMQLFSRGGAALIPILNEGGTALRALGSESDAFGTTISSDVLAASDEFQKNLIKIKAAGSGAAIQLTSELLPSLNQFSDAIVADLKRPDSSLRDLVTGIGDVTKGVYLLGDGFMTVAETAGKVLAGVIGLALEEAEAAAKVAGKLVHLDFKGAEASAKDGAGRIAAVFDSVGKSIAEDWEKFGQTAAHMFASGASSGAASTTTPAGLGGGVPKIGGLAGAATEDPVKKLLASVQEQIKSELELIGIINQGKSAYEVQKAEMDERKKLTVEQIQLQTQLNGLQAQRAEASSGGPSATAEIDRKIADTKAQLAELQAGFSAAVTGAGIGNLAGQVGTSGTGLEQLLDDQKSELTNIEAINAAMRAGGAGIAAAQIEEKFRKQTEALAAQRAELERIVPATDDEQKAVAALTAELDRQSDALKTAKENQAGIASEQITQKLLEATRSIQAQAASFDILAAAANRGAAAEREAAAAAAMTTFKAQNPQASGDQIAQAGANAAAEFNLKQQQSDQTHINALNEILSGYKDQYEALGRIAALAGQNSADQRVIAALVSDQNKEWDMAAEKFGNFTQQAAAFFDQLSQLGRNLGEQISADLMSAVEKFNSMLSQSLVTGKKMDWKKLLGSTDESLINTGMKYGEGFLAKGAGGLFGNSGVGSAFGALLGGSNKPDGSQSNPIYVRNIDALSSVGTGVVTAGAPAGLSSLLGLMDIPFLADGGDVTDGKPYIVGEEHPEFFIPGKSGMIAPTLKTQGGGTHITNVNFHGVTDHDSFKQNQTQIMNRIALQVSRAAGRK